MSQMSPVAETVPSPTTRLRKGYSNQSRDGVHMVDLVDSISGHTIATCVFEPYADEILAALHTSVHAQAPTEPKYDLNGRRGTDDVGMEPTEQIAWWEEQYRQAATEIERLRGLAQTPSGLIHPDVLMNVVQAKLNDYIELHNRGDLTEHGDHAWLALVNLQRNMEFALSQSSTDRTLPTRCRNCGEPTRAGMFCGTCREMGCGDTVSSPERGDK